MCSSEKESEPLVTLVRPQKAASFTPSQRVSQTRGIYIWSQPSVAQSGVPYTYFQTVLNCFTIVLPPTPLVHSERTELCLDCTTHSTQCSTHSQQYILQWYIELHHMITIPCYDILVKLHHIITIPCSGILVKLTDIATILRTQQHLIICICKYFIYLTNSGQRCTLVNVDC